MTMVTGTITMNSSSLIVADSITIAERWAGDSSTIEVEVEGSTGLYEHKILNLTNEIIIESPNVHPFIVTGETGTVQTVLVGDSDHPARYEYWVTNRTDLPDTKDKVYVNSEWSSTTELPAEKIYGFNAFDKVADAVNEAPLPIFVEGGSYDNANAPTFNGVKTTIEAGMFTTSVCGGFLFSGAATGSKFESIGGTGDKKDITFTIEGGIFQMNVFAGDRVNQGSLHQTRTGDIKTTISGGEFNYAVAGAMALTASNNASAELNGDVSLTITGGTFNNPNNRGWIYGGSLSLSKTVGTNTSINGNVTVTLDATNNAITVSNLVVGSYGYGSITENATLVLTGNNNIYATGEIWGGCSSDIITIKDGKRVMEESKVLGKRILSFTGFRGTLASGLNKIRAFSDIEFKGGSEAKLGGCINLSDTTNWSFENGSSLAGDFINDFEGDTLNLTGFSESGILMSYNTSNTNDIFNGFDALGAIQMNGVTQSMTYSSTDTTMTWAFSGGSVVVDKTAGTMSFIA